MARQRKMTAITISEVSGVDFPAHGAEGWVLRKSAGDSDLPAGAFKLKPHEEALAASILRGVDNGQMIEFDEAGVGTQLGKSPSGVPFILTVKAIEKAAGQAAARERGIGQLPSQRN